MEPIDGNKNPATESCGLRPEDHTGIAAHSPSSERVLDFTIAPVQGFVGQARRTRDFWAGSYLISYLTAHAIKAVLEVGATDHNETAAQTGSRIIFPHVDDDPLLAAVMGLRLHSPGQTRRSVASCSWFSAECYDPAAAGGSLPGCQQYGAQLWRCGRQSALGDSVLQNSDFCLSSLASFFRRHGLARSKTVGTLLGCRGGAFGVDQRNWRQMHMFDGNREVCTMAERWSRLERNCQMAGVRYGMERAGSLIQ